jgi:hypothetical protein
MNKNLSQAKMYLQKNGAISIPFLQRKFKLAFKDAKKLYEKLVKSNG